MVPQLLATTGPLSGQTLPLQPGENTLGREVGNSIVIEDQAVSRRHARILVVNGVATVEDAGSSGGTWVNDLRVTAPTLLNVGDSLRLGGTVFSFIPGSVAQPDMGQRKPREQSRYKEAPAPFVAPMPSAPNTGAGCMPDVSNLMRDMQGCIGPLMKYLIIAAIILLVLCLIGGLIAGIGAIGAVGAGAAAAGGAAGGAPAAGGGAPPPANQPPPNNQPPPPPPPAQTQPTASIEIVKIRIAYLMREGYQQPQPVVLVTWRNRSDQAVAELDGDIKGFDSANRPVGLVKKATLYKGTPIQPGQSHEDAETDGTIFPVDTPQGQAPPLLDHAEIDKMQVATAGASQSGQDE